MELDPVVESFVAITQPFVDGIEEAIRVARDFRDELIEIQALLDALPLERTVRLNFETSGVPGSAAAGAAGAAAIAAQADALQAARDAAYEDAAANAVDAASTRSVADAAEQAARTKYMLAMADQVQANTARDAADSQRDAANAAGNAARLWGVLPLTWNAIHWAITGTAEALAVIIPAMVAAGSAAAVGLQGAVDVADRMRAVYQATEATYTYLGKTISTGLGQNIDQFTASAGKAAGAGNNLHDALQQAQNAAQPHVYELLGATVDGATGKFDVFNTIGQQTIGMLDTFAAKIDIELAGPMGNLANQLTTHAVPDLQELGQVFGNIGHAVANAAADMPGMAEALLHILDAGSQVLVWALHFQGVMEGLLLAHEAQMWGGLLSGVLGRVATGFAAATTAMGAFAVRGAELAGFDTIAAGAVDATVGLSGALQRTAGFLGGPWGTVVVGAGIALAFLISKLGSAQDATTQWISSVEASVAQARGLQQMSDTYAALQQTTQKLGVAQHDAARAQAAYNTDLQTGAQAGSRFDDAQIMSAEHLANLRTQMNAAQGDSSALSAAQQQLSQDWLTENSNVRLLASEYKVSYTDAAQLASAAGVSLTQTLKGNSVAAQEARQQITNLIAGYGGMAAVGSELGQDINAVSFAAAIQNGNVAKLNQSWDTFVSTVQAPSSTFLSFAQSLTQFSSDAGQAGASISGLGDGAIGASKKMTTASIQLQQDFNTSVTSAEQMLDSLRTVAAITGNGGPLVQGIKDTVAAFIPMAGTNAAARAQVFALAQEAAGPASGSLQALAKWAGNTKDPLTALQSLSMQAAGAIQKLGADTQALAATMQSSLNQTLVTEAQNLTGVTAKTAAYLTDLQNLGPGSLVTQSALDQLNSSVSSANALATTASGSISALSGKIADEGNAASANAGARQKVNDDIQRIISTAPGASSDVDALAKAIENQGATSSAAGGARGNLIRDLESMHLSAMTATSWVDALSAAINGLHSKTITLTTIENTTVTGSGAGISGTQAHLFHSAAGMRVPGYGGGDIVPAMLEPGEAVVPKHLVPYISGFLGAHHVPGFAEGGRVHHPGPGMSEVVALWAAELWKDDLQRHGRHSPVALAEMAALWGGAAPGHGLPHTALGALLAHDEHARMGHYRTGDIEYWRAAARLASAEHGALPASERARARALVGPSYFGYKYPDNAHGLAEALAFVRRQDEQTLARDRRAVEELLKGLGYSRGGLAFGAYDSGGYLPVGLSMAYNGTGKPEPVGGGGGPRSPQPLHIHVNLNGSEMATAIVPDLVAAVSDYNYLNTGRPTGKLNPGP